MRAANECMKIYGSYGFSTEFPAERFYRDAKSLQVVEGTSNIQKVIIAGMALGLPAFAGLLKQHGISGPITIHFEYPLGGAEHDARILHDAVGRELHRGRRAEHEDGGPARHRPLARDDAQQRRRARVAARRAARRSLSGCR